MSEYVTGGETKMCATCQYWAGSRHTDAGRKFVWYVGGSFGECIGGGMNHSNMPAAGNCNKHCVWPVISR